MNAFLIVLCLIVDFVVGIIFVQWVTGFFSAHLVRSENPMINDHLPEAKKRKTSTYDHLKEKLNAFLFPEAVREGAGKNKVVLFDTIKSIGVFLAVTGIGVIFDWFHFSEANIIMIYILGTVLTSVITDSMACGIISSILSVFVFNYLFTEPRYTLFVYETGYPFTFLIMFAVALITGTLARRLKVAVIRERETAERTQIMLDSSNLLESASDTEEVLRLTRRELRRLFGKNVFYGDREEVYAMSGVSVFPFGYKGSVAGCFYTKNEDGYISAPDQQLGASIVKQCEIAYDNQKNRAARAEAELKAQKELLRNNLLRSISHDIRTPLTAISGHASSLLQNEDKIRKDMRMVLYQDIYDDSIWLIDMVENLLSISRITDKNMNFHFETENLEDIIADALTHIRKRSDEHTVRFRPSGDVILVNVDSMLITQVLLNLVNNAFQYTPAGSEIMIRAERDGYMARVFVADQGPGIPDEQKEKVFELFYSGDNTRGDNIRRTGIGLAVCRSIVEAHGGKIEVRDNEPCGSVFVFTLPVIEVEIDESC